MKNRVAVWRRLRLETLEVRRVCAGITGFVAIDSNQNGQFDSGSANPNAIPIDQPVDSARVWIDSNANGQFDAGEPEWLTDSAGSYQFTGLGVGTYSVHVSHTPVWYRLPNRMSCISIATRARASSV